MSEQRGCATCKYDHLDNDEEPCIHCIHSCEEPHDFVNSLVAELGLPLEDCYEPKPKPTNADHIRSMSDDELAEFLADFKKKGSDMYCDNTDILCWGTCTYNHACQDNPKELIKMFLQAERKAD